MINRLSSQIYMYVQAACKTGVRISLILSFLVEYLTVWSMESVVTHQASRLESIAACKVPGCRKVTVPYYVGLTTINVCNAIRVLYAPSVQYLVLLWGSLSAFVYVRIFVFHVVSGGADYMVI